MYQWVPSDAHNAEAHIADHAVPSGGGGYKVVDRLDHYAVRRPLHLLTAATLFHDAAAQALLDRRNDPDLINLGQWNDGTVVQPLQILNEPTTSRPTESFKNPLADRQLVQARPTVDFTGPLTTVRGQTVTFTATASDSDGNVDNVALLVNGQVMDVRTAPPWNLVWTAVTDGSVAIGVRAEDDDGMMATSVEKNLDVTAPPLPPSGTSGESADGGSGGGCGSGGLALVMAAGFAFNLVRRRSQYQFK